MHNLSLQTFNVLVACDAVGVISGIPRTFLEISQGTRTPGNTLGKALSVEFAKSALFKYKDQREGRGIGTSLVRGSHLVACLLQRPRPGRLLREGRRVGHTVVSRRETKALSACGESGVLGTFCGCQPP